MTIPRFCVSDFGRWRSRLLVVVLPAGAAACAAKQSQQEQPAAGHSAPIATVSVGVSSHSVPAKFTAAPPVVTSPPAPVDSTRQVMIRGTAYPIPPDHRAITLPRPPYKVASPVRSVNLPIPPSAHIQQNYPYCSAEDYFWPMGRTGGPFPRVQCFAPNPSTAACLEVGDPSLVTALNDTIKWGSKCVYDGPVRQPNPGTNTEVCCYVISYMGEGRPLYVDQHRVVAPLTDAAHVDWCLAPIEILSCYKMFSATHSQHQIRANKSMNLCS